MIKTIGLPSFKCNNYKCFNVRYAANTCKTMKKFPEDLGTGVACPDMEMKGKMWRKNVINTHFVVAGKTLMAE